MVARYENNNVGTDRVRFRFQFENYHEQWNPATRQRCHAGESACTGRRQNFEPEVTFVLAKPLTLSVGASFQQMEEPVSGRAARGRQRPDLNSALSSAIGGFGKPARPGRRVQPARGHQNFRQRFRLCASPGAVPVHADAGQECRDRRSDRRDDLRPGAAVRAIRARQRQHAAGLEQVRPGSARVETGWSTIPSSIGTEFFKFSTIRAPFGTAAKRRCCGIPSGVGLRQGVFSLAVAFPLREGHIDPDLHGGHELLNGATRAE